MNTYKEASEVGNPYRDMFLHQVEALINTLFIQADRNSTNFFSPDMTSVNAYEASLPHYRQKYLDMLGWLLNLPRFSVFQLLGKNLSRPMIREASPGCPRAGFG